MIIRKYRLQSGWSQDQLAEIAGLSVRTVQRIERGQTPGLESLKSLAAAFDISLDELNPETDMRLTQQPWIKKNNAQLNTSAI